VGLDRGQQAISVSRLRDDLEAGVAEKPSQALADEGGVVGQDYPHGISALTTVP
jgi:hypothetical protein